MEKIGRNDLCSCGSGKKYKQCCLNNKALAETEVVDHVWYRLRSATESLPMEFLKFAKTYFSYAVIQEAWDEFTQGKGGDFPSDTPHMSVFMPWFYYDWCCKQNNIDSLDEHNTPTLAQAYLKKKRQSLDPLTVRYIEQCCAASLSFFDIVSVRPNHGMVMRDIFTGELIEVIERSGSKHLQPDDILCAKVVRIDPINIIEACAPIAFPPAEKASILALRKFMQTQRHQHTPLMANHLKAYEFEILDAYYTIAESLLHPVKPEYCNTDGDAIMYQTILYDIDSPHEAFDALKHLCITESPEELLEDASFNSAGELDEIKFSWQKKGNKLHKDWSNTVLGHIKISKEKLSVEVNSEKRAKKLRSLIGKLLVGKARYRTTVIESPNASSDKAQRNKSTKAALKQIDDLNALPEIQAMRDEKLRAHYRDWIKHKIPALDNKTPLQAMKTQDGMEMVKALLAQLERQLKNMHPPADVSIVDDLRASLRLENSHIPPASQKSLNFE